MKIIAHRGVHEKYGENTMDAFLEGFRMDGIAGIEVDVRTTKDKQFVLIHNQLINLTSDGMGFVRDKTLKELRRYNFGTKEYPSKISTLEELLRVTPRNKLLMIELKEEGSFPSWYLEKLLFILKKHKDKNLYIASFNRLLLDEFLKKTQDFKVGLIVSTVMNRKCLNRSFDFQAVHYSLVSSVDSSMESFFWTVDKPESVLKLKRYMQDFFLITDKPSLFIRSDTF